MKEKYSKKKSIKAKKLNKKYTAKLEELLPEFSEICKPAYIEKAIKTAKKYIKHGADINVKNLMGETLLIKAVKMNYENSVDFMKYLVDNGADINLTNHGKNALTYAILANKTEIAKVLIDCGTDLTLVYNNQTALMQAASKRNCEIVKQLVDRDDAFKFINYRDNKGNTALNHALTYYSDKNSANKIIEHLIPKSNLEIKNNYESTPLNTACSNNEISLKVIKMLVEAGANLNTQNHYGQTPLLNAVNLENEYSKEICDYLIEKGADTTKQNKTGQTYSDFKKPFDIIKERSVKDEEFSQN